MGPGVTFTSFCPKMRSRAAWYRASRAAYELSAAGGDADAEDEEDGNVVSDEEVGVAVGRLRMRRTGWNAAGGGGDAALGLLALEAERTSSGMGVRLFLSAFVARGRAVCMIRKHGRRAAVAGGQSEHTIPTDAKRRTHASSQSRCGSSAPSASSSSSSQSSRTVSARRIGVAEEVACRALRIRSGAALRRTYCWAPPGVDVGSWARYRHYERY